MILCLDYGTRYIGLAITDDEERLAVRHSVIDQKQEAALAILEALIIADKVDTVLVGVPISLSGNESEQTKITREFITQLRQVVPENVTLKEVDETLTSFEADRRIAAEGGRKDDAHAEAARIMLDEYLQNR
jgi:putative holliday junction resolvase